jgi:hypothetical protein
MSLSFLGKKKKLFYCYGYYVSELMMLHNFSGKHSLIYFDRPVCFS